MKWLLLLLLTGNISGKDKRKKEKNQINTNDTFQKAENFQEGNINIQKEKKKRKQKENY